MVQMSMPMESMVGIWYGCLATDDMVERTAGFVAPICYTPWATWARKKTSFLGEAESARRCLMFCTGSPHYGCNAFIVLFYTHCIDVSFKKLMSTWCSKKNNISNRPFLVNMKIQPSRTNMTCLDEKWSKSMPLRRSSRKKSGFAICLQLKVANHDAIPMISWCHYITWSLLLTGFFPQVCQIGSCSPEYVRGGTGTLNIPQKNLRILFNHQWCDDSWCQCQCQFSDMEFSWDVFFKSSRSTLASTLRCRRDYQSLGWRLEYLSIRWLKLEDTPNKNLRKKKQGTKIIHTATLPETNIAPKIDGWNTTFLLGRPIFRGKLLVSGRLLFNSNLGVGFDCGIWNFWGWGVEVERIETLAELNPAGKWTPVTLTGECTVTRAFNATLIHLGI